ncbi:MAG: aspartate kinase, partial [Desulfovibrio sp.]|nr:aspartate kinase [Desulfovibrio sp.]
MKILVQKFGGTSVTTLERMQKVREKVTDGLGRADKVVAVLSARAGDTDNLLALAGQWSKNPDRA